MVVSLEMKETGIEWIGKIPTHWKLMRFRYVCKVRKGLQIPQTERFWEPGQNRLPYITIKYLNKENPDYVEYIENAQDRVICNSDDVLLARTGATGEVVTNQHGVFHNNFFLIDYDRKLLIKDYLVYYLLSPKLKEHIIFLAGTTTIPDLNHDEFLNVYVLLPPLHEQTTISKYLNKERKRLLKLINNYLRLIRLLKEKRQAIINQSVTKGLDPTVSMKDSEIEWIGYIPEHWKVKRLKFSAKIELSSVDRHEREGEEQVLVCHYPNIYKNEKITKNTLFTNGTCTLSELEKFRLKKDDVIITKDSETADDIGVPALVIENIERTVCGYHLAQITSNKKEILGNFLFRFIQTDISNACFEISSHGITRFGLGKDSIGNLFITQPSINEQKEISEFLDSETFKIDSLIIKTKSQIGKLQEFRQSLISSVVTGKIDLREGIIV